MSERPSTKNQSPESNVVPINTAVSLRGGVSRILASVKPESRELSSDGQTQILSIIEGRFSNIPKHYARPEDIDFEVVQKALKAYPKLMWSVARMQDTGGEPDVIVVEGNLLVFCDCSPESPLERRSLNYYEALEMARSCGVNVMNQKYYELMQSAGKFDIITCNWLKTPYRNIEKGEALRAYRNGDDIYGKMILANSRSRNIGWRGVLKVPRA